MIRAFVVALWLVAMLSGSASAECTWVLWADGTLVGEHPPELIMDGGFKPRGGWTTRSECEAEKALEIKREERRRGTPEAKADWRRLMGEYADKAKMVVEYVCLPDTIDPRGPKGK